MIFFYEIFFVLVAVAAVFIGEAWSRLAAVVLLSLCFALTLVAYASFGARLAASTGLTEEDRRWYVDARDGLRHLRLLFGIAVIVALAWRIFAG